MKRSSLVLLKVVFFLVVGLNLTFASEIVWEDISRENLDVKAVWLNPKNPDVIFFGSNKGVFKTEDAGLSWRCVLTVKGQNSLVNFFLSEPESKNCLYAATGNGLFCTYNMGGSWQRIFQGKNYSEAECTVLEANSSGIYLGTGSGLFVSKDKGRTWQKTSGVLGKSRILAIASNPKQENYIYVASVNGVFRTQDAGESWEKIFGTNLTEDNDDIEEQLDDQNEKRPFSNIRYISIEPKNPDCLYLATAKGIYKSIDKGTNWELVSSYGLLDRDVIFLLVSGESNLYAMTKSGIFVYKEDRWHELSQRLLAKEVRFLVQDNYDNLYVAADKGLFKGRILKNNGNQDALASIYYKDEPLINDVQQAAIRYAEVEPQKIKHWRKQAASRALLPKLTIGFDRGKNRTTSNSIWGTYGTNSSPGKYFVGPDDVTRYNNKNWDISLTWELGDLIWNGDQTSIDLRSRLMVELRDDILDETTKLYFERIRVKMEIDNLSIEDRKKRAEKELRLKELTAYLDGLTGGYFSSQIEKRH